MDRLNIFAIARDDGACTQIRLLNPLRSAARNDYAGVALLDKGIHLADVDEFFEEKMPDTHMVWFGRTVSPAILEGTKDMRAAGKKVVVDLDDDIFNISPWSAHFGEFAVSEFSYQGKPVWKDGENMNIAENRKKQDLWKKYLGIVDAVTVTTQELAEAYAPYAKQVIIIPNAIDFKVWDNPHRYHKTDEVRVFWQGGISHYEDWDQIRGAFAAVAKMHPEVKWVFQGVKFDYFLKDVPHEFHPWVVYDAHAYKMQTLNIDIGIAPLADTVFNRCKSNIKVLEYSAMGIPSVASDVAPYSRTIQHGATGFLASDERDFVRYVSELVGDPILRAKMGNMARHHAKEKYDVDDVSRQMVERFKELCFS